MAGQRFGNRLDGRFSSIIAGARLDLLEYLRITEHYPPAMFSDLPGLRVWADSQGLGLRWLDGCDEQLAELSGELPSDGIDRLIYRQVWARAGYRPYREAWACHHARADGLARTELTTLHADHVINKARLEAHYPEAWVMLFPVPNRSNSPFGSAVEKALPELPPGLSRLDLDPLVLFKLLSAEFPKDAAELATQLKAIAGQAPDWCARQVQQALHLRYPQWAPA